MQSMMISIIFDVKMTKPKGTVRCQTQMEINVYSVDRDDGAYLLYGDSDAGTREARVRSGIPRNNPAPFKLCDMCCIIQNDAHSLLHARKW